MKICSSEKLITSLFLVIASLSLSAQGSLRVKVSIAPSIAPKTSNGKLYIIATKNKVDPYELIWYNQQEYIFYTNPISSEYLFSSSVENIEQALAKTFDHSNTTSFPRPMNQIAAGQYYISAVWDIDDESRDFAYSNGNLLADIETVAVSDGGNAFVSLTLKRKFELTPFVEAPFVKKFSFRSEKLSSFFGKDYFHNAGIVLPPSYNNDANKTFPVIYILPAFERTYYDAMIITYYLTRYKETEKIYVVLDPSCKYGNHVFADSENNGPHGEALIEELIPALEKTYRISAKPQMRFLVGHSSGGWAGLHLQIKYPSFFGGVWATSPDPVDFHSFHDLNIYDSTTNTFYDKDGSVRLLKRLTTPNQSVTYKQFSDFEKVIVQGQQLGSFEAVFSPKKGELPEKLWDRESGKISATVAEHWKKYDLNIQLRSLSTNELRGLQNKIHIWVGSNDEFYLDKSVSLLENSAKALGLGLSVKYIKGATHSDVLGKATYDKIDKEINAMIRSLP